MTNPAREKHRTITYCQKKFHMQCMRCSNMKAPAKVEIVQEFIVRKEKLICSVSFQIF